MTSAPADIALIGGTGFYRFLDDAEEVEVETPYGPPSAKVSLATLDGVRVAFLPRHGTDHRYLPSEVPYAANLWALRSLGARRVIAFNTVGSLQPEIRRGDFVFCDQFVDRTYGRKVSAYSGRDGAHVSLADPYCPTLRPALYDAVAGLPYRFHPTGTVVVIEGPRFSTRAESLWFTQMGWGVVNMTQFPEVAIARELELCYANLSYVTDYDVAAKEIVGEEGEAVSHAMVVREFSLNSDTIVEVVRTLVAAAPPTDDCSCRTALANARFAR
jgi:5'-methylthioadenosine phosphorylase